MMSDKVKEAFRKCDEFIENSTPQELEEYEKSLNIDYEKYDKDPQHIPLNTPEDVIVFLSSMQDRSHKEIK